MRFEHIPYLLVLVIAYFAIRSVWKDVDDWIKERHGTPAVPAATLVQAGYLLNKGICFHCRHHDTIPGKGARIAECSECGERMQVNATDEVTAVMAYRVSTRTHYNDKALRNYHVRQRA